MTERFETYSFLPPLSQTQIDAHIDQLIERKLVPLIEYNDMDNHIFSLWNLWHLPKGATPTKLLIKKMLGQCAQNNPNAYVRLSGYNKAERKHSMSFIVHSPRD